MSRTFWLKPLGPLSFSWWRTKGSSRDSNVFLHSACEILWACRYVIPCCRNSSRQQILWPGKKQSQHAADICWVQWPVWTPFLRDVYLYQTGRLLIRQIYVPVEISWIGRHTTVQSKDELMPSRPRTMRGYTPFLWWLEWLQSMFKLLLLCSSKLSSHADPGSLSKISEDARREEKAGPVGLVGPVGPGDVQGQGLVCDTTRPWSSRVKFFCWLDKEICWYNKHFPSIAFAFRRVMDSFHGIPWLGHLCCLTIVNKSEQRWTRWFRWNLGKLPDVSVWRCLKGDCQARLKLLVRNFTSTAIRGSSSAPEVSTFWGLFVYIKRIDLKLSYFLKCWDFAHANWDEFWIQKNTGTCWHLYIEGLLCTQNFNSLQCNWLMTPASTHRLWKFSDVAHSLTYGFSLSRSADLIAPPSSKNTLHQGSHRDNWMPFLNRV